MQVLLLNLRRFFYFLGDVVVLPFRFLAGLWKDARHGRTLLFGLPSIAIFLFASVSALLAFSSQSALVRRYENAREIALQNKDRAAAITYTQKLLQLQPNEKTKYELAELLEADDSDETGAQNRQRAMSIFNALAPDDRPGYPDAHVRKAQQIFNNNTIPLRDRLKLAEKQLELALLSDPGNSNALTARAQLAIVNGKYEEALDIFTKLFRENDNQNVALHRKIAELYAALNRGKEAEPYIRTAIAKYEDLLKEQPGNIDYIRRLANAHVMLAEFDEAIDVVNKAIEAVGDSAGRDELVRSLAGIHVTRAENSTKELQRRILKEMTEKRIKAGDTRPVPNDDLQTALDDEIQSNAEWRQNYLDALIEAYRLDPGNANAMRKLTEFADADFPESNTARNVYDARIDPDSADDNVLQMIGAQEYLYGNRELGMSLWNKGLQKNPENHTILNNMAFALMETDLDRAESLVNKAIQIAPLVPNYYDTRGNIRIRQGKYLEAIQDLERAISGSGGLRKESIEKAYRALALCYEKLGMVEDAASYSRRADDASRQ
jgi:lipopolysaccharide biosynthesis regulator YciM